mmetsp:Transcript_20268/g.48988  ORF Transcript_20268/g.48988 Transcript_20268/m.48988 type:complete len:209 (-) Transcript_20268:144-770(-)
MGAPATGQQRSFGGGGHARQRLGPGAGSGGRGQGGCGAGGADLPLAAPRCHGLQRRGVREPVGERGRDGRARRHVAPMVGDSCDASARLERNPHSVAEAPAGEAAAHLHLVALCRRGTPLQLDGVRGSQPDEARLVSLDARPDRQPLLLHPRIRRAAARGDNGESVSRGRDAETRRALHPSLGPRYRTGTAFYDPTDGEQTAQVYLRG